MSDSLIIHITIFKIPLLYIKGTKKSNILPTKYLFSHSGEATMSAVTVLASDSPYGVVSWQTTSISTPEPEGTDSSVNLTVIRDQGLQGQLRVSYV